jgi:hypothetical protein|tara:strand:+ start:1564 stop:1698 length:135 start_codon:yes stop_codon:yes gene_type:complete
MAGRHKIWTDDQTQRRHPASDGGLIFDQDRRKNRLAGIEMKETI